MTTFRTALAGLLVLSLVSACSPQIRRHGYVPTEDELAQIVPGVDTRDAVLDLLPPPTASGVSGDMYFVKSQFNTFGPFAPREVSREIVAITVNNAGIVTGVERFGLEDGQVVPLSRRVTSDNVSDTTFLRQLMGNLGRFDARSVFGSDG